jgi:beta-lactamase regulating signal transducer with metallopeptidase domain
MMNGIYQGVIITTLVALGLRATRRTNAATRHAILFGTLMLVAALIPAHALRDYITHLSWISSPSPIAPRMFSGVEERAGERRPSFRSGIIGLDGARSLSALPSALGSYQGSSGTGSGLLAREFEPAVRAEELYKAESRETTADFVSHPKSSAEPTGNVLTGLPGPDGQGPSALISPEQTWLRRTVIRLLHPISWKLSSRLPRTTSLVLLSFCLGAAALRLALLLRNVRQMRRLKRASAAPSVAFAERFRALCGDLDMNRRVELRISSLHRSPILVGFLHPVILLPGDEARESRLTEFEQILSHELAHVRRWDDWANLVQHLVQAALFFHPAVWWISKRLVFEREIACDDWVLQRGTRPRAYALLLAELAKRISRPSLLLAPGASTAKSQLQQRINMILNTGRNTSTRLAASRVGIATTAAAFAAALALYLAPRLVMAQAQPAGTAHDGGSAKAELTSIPPNSGGPGVESRRQAPAPDLPGPPLAGPTAAPSLPLPAIIARQDFPSAPATPSVGLPEPSSAPRPAQPGALPRQPAQPEARFREASIEERLARVEEMVRSLLAQPGARFAPDDPFTDGKDSEYRERMRKQEMERQQGRFERQSAQAAEETARAREEHGRALGAEGEQREQFRLRDDVTLRMKALEEQRTNLERQMEDLRRQMEKLERERDNMKRRYQDDKLPEKQKEEVRPDE